MKSLEIPLVPKYVYCLQSFAFCELLRKLKLIVIHIITAIVVSFADNFIYFSFLLFHVKLVNLNKMGADISGH